MAFKLNTSDSFFFPVKIVTINDQGRQMDGTLTLQFKRLDVDARREREYRNGGDIYKQVVVEADKADDVSQMFTKELLKQGRDEKNSDEMTDDLLEIVVGWKDVIGEDDKPAEFSRDGLRQMVRDIPNFYAAVNDAYRKAYSGELKQKN